MGDIMQQAIDGLKARAEMARPVFGEQPPTGREVERETIQKQPKERRPMTQNEKQAAWAVSPERVTYLPGSPDKRFAGSVASIVSLAHEGQDVLITERQAAYLWRVVYRYRRQIKNKELIAMAERKNAEYANVAAA